MERRIEINNTLVVEIGAVLETGQRMIVIDRVAGGLVAIRLDEVKALINALSYLATAEATKDGEGR